MVARARSRFAVQLPVSIRHCTENDLRDLEWFGQFREHRAIIEAEHRRARAGRAAMLVAEARDGFPVGQIWVDLERRRDDGVALLWALRVLSGLRRLGIGTRLVMAAEAVALEHGFRAVEIGVEKHNAAARALYERMGYRLVREQRDAVSYGTPDGRTVSRIVDQWMLEKVLVARAAFGADR